MSPCISQVNQQTRFLHRWFLQLSHSITWKFRFNNQVCSYIWFLHLISKFPALHGSFGSITRFVVNLRTIISVSESRMWKNLVPDQLRLDAPYTFEIFSLSISWTKRQASEGRKTFKLNLPKTMKSHKPGFSTKGFNYEVRVTNSSIRIKVEY